MFRLNQKGVTLVELIIAVGISAIVATGMGYLILQGMSENRGVQSQLEIDRLGREIKNAFFRVGKSCANTIAFLTPMPAGAGPHTVDIRMILPTGEVIEPGAQRGGQGYEIAEVRFANAVERSTDVSGNRLLQGQIEIRARKGISGTDTGKVPLRRTIVGSMLAKVDGAGNFVDCFTTNISAESSLCNALGLQFDSALGTCQWNADMVDAAGSNCNDDQPIVGVANGGKLCDRVVAEACSGDRIMKTLVRGRVLCKDLEPAEREAPPIDAPLANPLPSYASPTPIDLVGGVFPPAPPPVTTVTPGLTPTDLGNLPAEVVAPNPPAAPNPRPSEILAISPPQTCNQQAAQLRCEQYCVGYFFEVSCSALCASLTSFNNSCGAVEQIPPAPPITTQIVPPPTPIAPPSNCYCGGAVIPHGHHCGYCFEEYEPTPSIDRFQRPLVYTLREESMVCNNGQLEYTAIPNPNRGLCNGAWEHWP